MCKYFDSKYYLDNIFISMYWTMIPCSKPINLFNFFTMNGIPPSTPALWARFMMGGFIFMFIFMFITIFITIIHAKT